MVAVLGTLPAASYGRAIFSASRQAVPGKGSYWVGRLRRLPCGPRPMGVPHNSLRDLRSLRSDRMRQVRSRSAPAARRPSFCGPRRPTSRPHRAPPAASPPAVACGRVVRHHGLQGPGPACAGLRVRRRAAQPPAGCGSPQGDPSSEACPSSGSQVGRAATRPRSSRSRRSGKKTPRTRNCARPGNTTTRREPNIRPRPAT